MPWDFALILLVLGVLVPWRGAVQIRKLMSHERVDTAERLSVYASTIALQWLATGVVLWRVAARGLQPERLAAALPDAARSSIAFLLLASGILIHQAYSLRRLSRMMPEEQGILGELARKLMPQNFVERLAFVGLAATVAPCEELLYRGFVFAVMEDAAGGSAVFAALASSAFFALAHLYQGRRGVASTFLVGLLFAGVRVWTGSLAPCIGTHLVVDLYAGLAAPGLLRLKNGPQVPGATAEEKP
jgi:membrane protease YdiL (CAAX protease family)